jgi:hypothetical protein
VLLSAQAENLWNGEARNVIDFDDSLNTRFERFREINNNVFEYYVSDDVGDIRLNTWSYDSRPTATILLEIRLSDYTLISPGDQPKAPTVYLSRGPPNPFKTHDESDVEGTGRWYNWIEYTRTQHTIVRAQVNNWR